MDIRPLLQLSTVLLAVGALGYYGYGGWDEDELGAVGPGDGPDYIISQVDAWQTDSKGQLIRRFAGSQLIHTPSPELFELREPRINLYSNGRPLWSLEAQRATSPDPGRDIWLQGNVVAVRDASRGSAMRIETSRLHANPKGDRLDTPEKVVVTGPQGRLSGRGLSADMNAGTLQFSSSVEVRYAPSY